MSEGKWVKGTNGYGWENAKLARYHKDWLNGKVIIPGLKISIKDAHGNEWGPCTAKIKERIVNRGRCNERVIVESVSFTSTPKVVAETPNQTA